MLVDANASFKDYKQLIYEDSIGRIYGIKQGTEYILFSIGLAILIFYQCTSVFVNTRCSENA